MAFFNFISQHLLSGLLIFHYMKENVLGMYKKEETKLLREYWLKEEMRELPVSFRLGDYFLADKFKAAENLLKPG